MQVDMSQTDNNLTNICSVFFCSVQDHRWPSVRSSSSGVRRWRSTGSPRYSLRPSLKVRLYRLCNMFSCSDSTLFEETYKGGRKKSGLLC